jgi:hypothetical protein
MPSGSVVTTSTPTFLFSSSLAFVDVCASILFDVIMSCWKKYNNEDKDYQRIIRMDNGLSVPVVFVTFLVDGLIAPTN